MKKSRKNSFFSGGKVKSQGFFSMKSKKTASMFKYASSKNNFFSGGKVKSQGFFSELCDMIAKFFGDF